MASPRNRFELLATLPWLIFAGTLAAFWYSAAPTVTFHDSGEFALAAASAGIPHPPGAASYSLCATLWVHLIWLLAPSSDPARLTNLFSGLMGALTVAFVSATVRDGLRQLSPQISRGAVVGAMLIVPALLLHSSAFVEQSTTTEQYTFLTAILSGMLWLALQPYHRAKSLGLGLLAGLGTTNHLSQIVLLPLLLAGCTKRTWRRDIGGGTLGFVLGLASFLYVPIRSQSNPLLDWGNVKTLDRVVWALAREQWKTRPLSAAPPGLLSSWIESYDWLGQVGVVGLLCAVVGVVVLVKRRPLWLAITLLIGVSYASGMLLAHLKQELIDVTYIRAYGVIDWHIPLYTLLALLAGIGAGLIFERSEAHKLGRPVSALAVLVLLALGIDATVRRYSLRNFTSPQTLIDTTLAPLPQDAVILPTHDNMMGLLYVAWAPRTTLWDRQGLGTRRWTNAPFGQLIEFMEKTIARTGRWTASDYASYVETVLHSPIYSPLRLPALTVEHAQKTPCFTEYSAHFTRAGQYFAPAGLLFEVMDHPVSNDEARQRDAAWRTAYPDALHHARGNEHRLERETWGLQYQNRGAYFFERQMWPEAIREFEGYCSYLPDNGDIWFCLGFAREQVGEKTAAAEAYAEAIRAEPWKSGPRANLALILAEAGKKADAIALLEEEVAQFPQDTAARTNLDLMRGSTISQR